MRTAEPPRSGPPGSAEVLTLVFTDLAGSTRLKERLGNAEGLRLIHEHHAVVRGVLAEHPEGTEISTAGDSFFLAFRRPSDAVAFALRLQARVREWNRGQRARLEDRIGIHGGEVQAVRDADGRLRDVHGLEVDKCARVMALAGARRVFITRFVYDNARPSLRGRVLPGIGPLAWYPVGPRAVKGVTEPLELFEVAESGFLARLRASPWKRIGEGALLGALAAVLGGQLPPLVDASFDLGYLTRRATPPPEVVLVYLDERSEEELGQVNDRDRWDRTLHAQLMDRLRESGCRAGVWDVVFSVPDTARPDADARLVEAARRWGKVAVAGLAATETAGRVQIVRDEGPFPALAEVTVWGVVPKGDLDRPVRHLFPGSAATDGLPAVVARLLEREPPARWREGWIRYYGPAGTLKAFRFLDVLSGRIAATELTNRVVFVGRDARRIGFTRGWSTDAFPMPFIPPGGGRIAGVEVLATATCNLLRDEVLFRASRPLEALCLAVLGIVGGGLAALPSRRGGVAALGFSLLLAITASWQTWHTQHWLPWLAVSGFAVPLAMAWSFFRRPRFGTLALHARDHGHDHDRTGVATASLPAPGATAPRAPAGEPRPPVVPQYTLLREIGRGAYGRVWLARDALGLHRAIKVVWRESFPDPRPFDREFSGLQRFTPVSLGHPALMHVLHVGRDEAAGCFYCVLELADDLHRGPDIDPATYAPRTLAADLAARGPLAVPEARALGVRLAEALQFLHDHGLVHRDVKPANILHVRGQPKLGDLGLVTDMARPDHPVSLLGTYGYLPPEGPGTAVGDVFALGKLLYVAVTGLEADAFPELPRHFEQRADLADLLRLNDVWLRACDPEPARRFPSARALAGALRGLEKSPTESAA